MFYLVNSCQKDANELFEQTFLKDKYCDVEVEV